MWVQLDILNCPWWENRVRRFISVWRRRSWVGRWYLVHTDQGTARSWIADCNSVCSGPNRDAYLSDWKKYDIRSRLLKDSTCSWSGAKWQASVCDEFKVWLHIWPLWQEQSTRCQSWWSGGYGRRLVYSNGLTRWKWAICAVGKGWGWKYLD